MKLSVAMITYNHERFIAHAIESALQQQTRFEYEIVIADDKSTDKTASIVRTFHQRYPDKIIPHLRTSNLGPVPNFKETIQSCRGEYVAILEGDDYWTDDHKLQRQVDFLEAHPEYVLSCHRARVLDELGTQLQGQFPLCPAGTYQLEDLLRGNFVVACTAIYRKSSVAELPRWFCKMKMGDWPLWALAAHSGKIYLMDEAMATYRVHAGGIWSSCKQTERLKATIRMLEALDAEFDFQHARTVRQTVAAYSLQWAELARAQGDRSDTGRAVLAYLRNGGYGQVDTRRVLVGLIAYFLLGQCYKRLSRFVPLKPLS